jgi:hypothetical protein
MKYFLAALLVPALSFAEDLVQFKTNADSSAFEVLAFYEVVSKRKIWLSLRTYNEPIGQVSTNGKVEKDKALEIIRTGLNKAGLALKEDDANNTFVTMTEEWIKAAAEKSRISKPQRVIPKPSPASGSDETPRTRVRIIPADGSAPATTK